jgi:hypothetical protein
MALQMKKTSGGTDFALCARTGVTGLIGKITSSVIGKNRMLSESRNQN